MPTADLLETILRGSESDLDAARQLVAASRGKGDRSLVALCERAVAAAPAEAISFDAQGTATLRAAGKVFCGGRFAPQSIQVLRRSVAQKASGQPTSVRFSVIEGEDPVTDIGALQAVAHASTLFQAASQFNCLESPGPYLTNVASYLSDPTQGPRASISAFPGTLVRHYAAPDGTGGRLVQSQERQIDLLADALPAGLGKVQSGYLMTSCLRDVAAAARAFEENFDRIQVGVHDGAQVVLGHAWDGAVEGEPLIAQVFTSTLAAGGYGRGEPFRGPVEAISRQLLRAAYLGTLLAALDLGKQRVVLTMIGGGVFGNPHSLICESILWAIEQVEQLSSGPLEVVLNGRNLSASVGEEMTTACERRGGVHCVLERISGGQ
jgi:hypothetical protein